MGLVAIQCYLVGSFKSLVEKAKRITIIDLSSFSWNVFTVILTYYITLVGTLFGGVAGDSIWPESKGGYIGGVIVGGISGVIFSVVVIEYSLPDLCGKSVTDYFSYWIDVIGSIVSGSLIRERMFQALLTAFERQFEEFEMRFGAVENIFDVGGKKGLSEDSVAKIPKITVTSDNNVDTSGEKVSCSVCLQDFELGETVRSLPHCHHMFHVPCIDKWLIRHGSCPLCRRDL